MKFFKYILIVTMMLACAGTTHAVLYSDAYIYNAVYDSIYNSLVTTPPSAISPVGSRGATKLTLNTILNRIYDPATKSLRIAAIGGGGGGSDTVSFSWFSDTANYATSANATKILDYSIDFSGHAPALNDVLEFDGTKWVASAGSQNYFRRAVLDTAFAGAIVDSILSVRGKTTMTSSPIFQVFSGDGARMFAIYDDSTTRVSGGLYAQWLTLGTASGKLNTWYTDEGFFAHSIPPVRVKPFVFSFNEWGVTDTAFIVSKDSVAASGNFHLRSGDIYLDNWRSLISADTSGNIGWLTGWLTLSDENNRTVLNINDEFRLGTYTGYSVGNYIGKTHWKVSAFENHTIVYDSLTLGIEANPNEALLRMGTYIGTLERWYHSADSLFAWGNRPRRFIGVTVLDTFKGYYSGIVDSAKGARNANLLGSTISVSNTALPGSLITIAVANGTSFIGGSAPLGSIGINNNVAAANRLYIRYGVSPTQWGEIPYIRNDGSWSKTISLADTSNWAKTLQGKDSLYFLSRANHLGTQAIYTIIGLPDSIAAKLSLHAQADSAAIADSSVTTAFAWSSLWSGLSGVPDVIVNIQDSLNNKTDTVSSNYRRAGVYEEPSFTSNGDGSFTVGSGGVAAIYLATDGTGHAHQFEIPDTTITLVNKQVSFLLIVPDGLNAIKLENSTTFEPVKGIDTLILWVLYRDSFNIRCMSWDEYGKALPEKIMDRLVRTQRFAYESGLSIGETPTRHIIVDGGALWHGAVRDLLQSYDSSTDTLTFWFHSGGTWNKKTWLTGGQYSNNCYDDGTDTVALAPGTYTVNYVYKPSDSGKRASYVVGASAYATLDLAKGAPSPTPPDNVSAFGVYVGKIIVEQGASSAIQIDGAFTGVTGGGAPVPAHNSLTGIQGGTSGERYHLWWTLYDSLVDGTINAGNAQKADSADVVPWIGLTGVPATFPPSAHTQAITTITDLADSLKGKPDSSLTFKTKAERDSARLFHANNSDSLGLKDAGQYPDTSLAFRTKAERDSARLFHSNNSDSLGLKSATQYPDTSQESTRWSKVGGTMKHGTQYWKDSTNITITVAGDTGKVSLSGTVSAAMGGTGQNSSAWSGMVKTTAGTWATASAGTDYGAPYDSAGVAGSLSGFVMDSVAFSANYRKAVYIAGLTEFAIPTISFNVPCVAACSLKATPDSLIIRTYKMTTLGVWDTSATTGKCYYRVKK